MLAWLVVSGCERSGIALGSPVTIDVGTGWDASARAAALRPFLEVFFAEPLLGVGWEGRASADLAESYEWADGNRTLRLHLRRDALFHDGTRFTAADAVGVLERGRIAFATSVQAEDDYTVRVSLSRPDAFLLEQLREFLMIPADRPDVGTGPFKLVKQDGPAQLEKFDRYYRGRPAIDRIRVHTYDSQRAAWAAMLRGEVDYLNDVSREAVDFVEAQSNVNSYRYLTAYYLPLVFNLQHPVLKNVAVRRAINEAIDRTQIVSQAMRGRAVAANGPIWPEFWAASSTQGPYGFDPAGARARLDAAGYRVQKPNAPGMNARFRFSCLYWDEGPQYERIAVVLQKQLFEVGIDLEMRPMPLSDLLARVRAGDYDAFLVQMNSGRGLSWIERFWHSRNQAQGFNTHYDSADGVLDRLRLATSDEATRAGVVELQRVLHDDPPAAFLVWLMNARAASRRFDIPAERNRDILPMLWRWRPAQPDRRASR